MAQIDQHKIIILETNQGRRDFFRSLVSGFGYTPYSFENEAICLDNLSPLNPDLVISGPLSSERTFRFINALKMRNRRLPVLIISGNQAVQDFIKTNGFADVLVVKEPIEPYKIKREINRIKQNDLKSKMSRDCPLIIGNSPEMVKIKKMISELRDSKDTVLIQGGPGTGKELVARAIHNLSNRRNNPFVKVKVAGLSSEWFEYEVNALGGVNKNKKGMFELANKGTIYLDRIEKASASFQAKMLQILDGKST